MICLLFNHFDAMICMGRLQSYLCLPIPHDPRLGWNEGHSSFRDIPQFFIVPMRAHYSTRGMRSRSQQQVPNLVRHHIGQECMTKPSPLGKFLNAVIEYICKVPGAFRIRISSTEHIDAITKFGIHRMRTDLKS